MASPARTPNPGIFLVTLATYKQRPTFGTSRLAELFIDTILTLRKRGLFKLHAYLVLPDRVHLLLSPQAMPLEQAIETTEATFAQRLDTVQLVWEPGFQSHPIKSIRDLETLRTHLHQLPVRSALAPSPELYPYSSASRMGESAPQRHHTLYRSGRVSTRSSLDNKVAKPTSLPPVRSDN